MYDGARLVTTAAPYRGPGGIRSVKLCAVVAAWDERDNVGPLALRLLDVLRGMPGWTFEVVFVVEGTDGTREAIEALGAPEIRILYQEKPSGLGAAFRRGFAAVPSDADVVVTLDADLNH